MKCQKHPTYKGIKKTKRDCKTCLAIFKKRQEVERAKGGLHASVTTPGQSFGVPHILAEISCTMIYGKQPPFFWRKDSGAHKDVKDHYKSILMGVKKWKFKKYDTPIFGNNPVDVFSKILWYIAGRYDTDAKMRKIHGTTSIKKEDVIEKVEDTSEHDNFFDVTNVDKKTPKFQNLKTTGEQDDK
jgi:hypothetical protein